MSSGRVRNFRRRAEEDDKDEDDKEKTITPSTTTASKKTQSKPVITTTKPKRPSLLSFADDESTDVTVPVSRTRPSDTSKQPNSSRLSKPSSLSSSSVHKLTPPKDRISSKDRKLLGSSLPSNVQPQAGVYTKEALLELQKNFKTLGSSTARSRPPLPKSEPVIVLKGMIKPVVDDSLTGRKYDDVESDRDDSLDRGVIPDQAMIDATRAKRERLRQSRAAAPDFIALDGGSNHGEAEGLSDEEPEFQGRIALIGEKNDIKKGVFEDVVDLGKTTIRKETEVNFSDNGVDDEEDEEDKMWEEEQFRKGLGKRMDEGVVTRDNISSEKVSNEVKEQAMSSGRVRNFRRRAEEEDDKDEDDKEKTITPSTTTASKKTQSKPVITTTKPKRPSLLSFADDESTDVTVPVSRTRPSGTSKQPNSSRLSKPSSLSSSSVHKLTPAKDRISSKDRKLSGSSLPSNVHPQAGVYTKEALLELQKNSKSLGGSTARSRPPLPKSEPVIVLKGMIKPVVDDSLTGRKYDDGESDRDDSLDRGVIPDQAMIDAIRAKRERLRQSRAAAPDFIALDGGSNHGEAEGLSDEEPEFQGRIALIGEKNDIKKGVFEDVVVDLGKTTIRKETEVNFSDNGVDDEEDEEDKMWEEEQFRKGLGKRMDEGVVTRGAASSSIPTMVQNVQQKIVYSTAPVSSHPSVSGGLSTGGSLGWPSGSDTLPISQQAELSKKALHESVKRLKNMVNVLMCRLINKKGHVMNKLVMVYVLFIFYATNFNVISIILLGKRLPVIVGNQRNTNTQYIQQERTKNKEYRINVVWIQYESYNFNKGGTTTSMVEAATAAAQAALTALRESKNLAVKLDEFGRDVNLQNRMDMKRRAEARQRRKARSESKRMSAMETDSLIEGESSTDESDSDSSAYESNRDQLLQIAGQIFSDADEEFSQISTVKEKFEVWKKEYSSSYNDAYMSLSIPSIFSPYVRLELLKWDPLHQDSDFFHMKWHGLLYDYGMPEDKSKVNPDDADVNLVPDLVERVAVPILQYELAHCWDMLSTKETKYAVSATNLVFTYVSLSSEAVGELVSVLRDRLSDAVSHLMVPTWNTYVIKAVPNAARFAAYRFGTAVRLLRNICLWNNILSVSVLEKLALDELLSGKILPHLRSIQSNIDDAITRTERVVASISGVWTGPKVIGDRSPRLQPMVDYLIVLGRILEKKHSYSGKSGLARRLKKMLVELNEYDHARNISRTFNLKEAL
ncbi:hypothetical protein E3N88_35081 [Mikania micrantha]|uniref:GCF C-terminal domain-containing protein n=1 Tax=Mikania micrantha TaxID=192012 RepID=A0A5N6M085_9ASTR|nr:hypothetical protein E3N88_35081 [Mikania micrantha]